jgi:hypothetical protein
MILGRRMAVGQNTMVTAGSTPGFRLGSTTIVVGRNALTADRSTPGDVFQNLANRFVILINMTRKEFEAHEHGIIAMLRMEIPAHTAYSIRLIGESAVGQDLRLGINTKLLEARGFRVGSTSQLALPTTVLSGSQEPRLDHGPRLGGSAELV